MATVIGLCATSAQAVPITHNVSLTVDAPAVFNIGVNSTLGPGTLSSYGNAVYTGFPLTFADGDTIELDVTVNGGGIVMNNGPTAGALEALFGFRYRVSDIPFDQPTDNPTNAFMMTYDRTTTVTVTNFTGDLVSNTIVSSFVGGTNNTPAFNQISVGNYTNSTVSLTQFTIATTFTNINFLPGFETYASFQSITATNPNVLVLHENLGVPLPGALALIGVGLLGLVGLRRKAA